MPQFYKSNLLLASLPTADVDTIRPHLRAADLKRETVLFETGRKIEQVYFPYSGIVSLVIELQSGDTTECAMIGRDGLAGGSAAMGAPVAVCKGIVQIAGTGSSIEANHLARLAEASPPLRKALFDHDRLILVQSMQSAACNANHKIEARMARWLLRSRDLVGGDDLDLTQEFLSQMLAVRRTSVSVIANAFQEEGLIRYSRGHVHILDVEGLRKRSCECYETVKVHSDRTAKL
jgi:CRP-like cAMP-binding protein